VLKEDVKLQLTNSSQQS